MDTIETDTETETEIDTDVLLYESLVSYWNRRRTQSSQAIKQSHKSSNQAIKQFHDSIIYRFQCSRCFGLN